MEINQQIHQEVESYLKPLKKQTEGEYQCSPSAKGLYRFLKENYNTYNRDNPCTLETLCQVLNYWDRTGDKEAHDKCRAILDDIHEINNSQKWEKVICTNHRNGYWLSHDQKDVDDYLDFYRSKARKAIEREYSVLLKLQRDGQCKLYTNSYEPKPVEPKHEQFHEVYEKKELKQASIFDQSITAW